MATRTHEEITIGQLKVRPRVEPGESGGSVAIHEFDVPAGAGLPLAHSHDAYEETIYGLAGTVTFTIEGTPTEIGPGEAVCIRRCAVHSFANIGEIDGTALAIITPGILGAAYFRELAELVDADAGGPRDLAAIGELYRRRGLTTVP